MNSLCSKESMKKIYANSNNADIYDDFSLSQALLQGSIYHKPPLPLIHLAQTATSAFPQCMNNGARNAGWVSKTKQKLNMSSGDPRQPSWSRCQVSLLSELIHHLLALAQPSSTWVPANLYLSSLNIRWWMDRNEVDELITVLARW